MTVRNVYPLVIRRTWYQTRHLRLRAPYQGSAPYCFLGTNVVVVADDAVFQVSAAAHARAREQDAAFDRNVGPDPAVAADGYVPEELDVTPDHSVLSDQDVAFYLCGGVYLSILPDPQSLTTLLARDLDPDLAGEHVVLGLAVR